MSNVMSVIFTYADDFAMRELTAHRSVTALPVASRYRLVDFLLSGLVNSGINKVGLLVQGNYQSLMDHVSGGKPWNLHTRNNGLYILPPLSVMGNEGTYKGVPDALYVNMDFLRRSTQEYVLLLGGRMLYNARYDELIRQHIASGADITLMYSRFDPMTFDYSHASTNSRAFVQVDESGTVTSMELNPNTVTYPNMLMDVFLIKRTLLMQLMDSAASHGNHEFYHDILLPAVKEGRMSVKGYEFKGYVRRLETVKSYYNMSMELLNPAVRRELFGANPVYTKTRDDAPTRYLPGADVKNSLLADGCVVEGEVRDSVIFRGVHIGKGAFVRSCVIMQDCEIGENCVLENVILDKDVTLLKGGRLIGHRQYPVVLGKNVTL